MRIPWLHRRSLLSLLLGGAPATLTNVSASEAMAGGNGLAIVPHTAAGMAGSTVPATVSQPTGTSAFSFLAIGDSITAGAYNPPGIAPPDLAAADLVALGNKVAFGNKGIPGINSGYYLPGGSPDQFAAAVAAGAALSPPARVATIMLGTNDAAYPNQHDAASVVANVRTIATALVADGYTVIVMDVMYVNRVAHGFTFQWNDTSAALVPRYNAGFATLDNGTTIRYFGGLYAWSLANNNADNFRDGVHPTPMGAAAIGKTIAGYINTVVNAGARQAVATPGSDGFAPGLWFPDEIAVNSDTTTSTRIASGFTRGPGPWTYSVANTASLRVPLPPFGPSYITVAVDRVTARTSYFTCYLTPAGAALTPKLATGQYPLNVTITATNGTTTHGKIVALHVTFPGTDVVHPGGNVLVATTAAVGGSWTFAGGATAMGTLPTPRSSAPLPLIPNNRFEKYIRFFADKGDTQSFGGRATATANPAFYPRPPCFFAFFWKPENNGDFGEPYAYGDQTDQVDGGAIAFILEGNRIIQWTTAQGSTEATQMSLGPGEFATGGPSDFYSNGIYSLGQWMFSAMIFPTDPSDGRTTPIYYQNGLFGTHDGRGVVPWIKGFLGQPLQYSFGADRNVGAVQGADAHVFSGGVRNCVSVSGTPTNAELEQMRAGGDPRAIWRGRVLSYYAFDGTHDPELGQAEPDLTGNNGPATFHNVGWLDWAPPPQVASNIARLADRSGCFEMVQLSGPRFVIRTKRSVANLANIFGAYKVLLISANGFQFPTTLYVTDGS